MIHRSDGRPPVAEGPEGRLTNRAPPACPDVGARRGPVTRREGSGRDDTDDDAAGEWFWTDCGEDGEPALGLEPEWEIRAGDFVDAAYLARLARDLMKLAALVGRRPKP
jgi:hypothetical protein